MDIEALCRETALHLYGDLRSEAAIRAGIRQVRPTVEFVVARVRAEASGGDREALGRAVRAEWMAWAQEQPRPKPSWLVPWDELAEPDREADRRIGERLYGLGRAEAVADERRKIADELVKIGHSPDATASLLRYAADFIAAVAAGSVPVATSEEVNLADQFMPPSARIGDQEARRLGLMATGPVATPTEPREVDAVAEARREGWMPFGTLVDVQLPAGRVVQFSDELDEAGLPLWERIRSAAAPLDAPRTFG